LKLLLHGHEPVLISNSSFLVDDFSFCSCF
jgi:hypothetical protein